MKIKRKEILRLFCESCSTKSCKIFSVSYCDHYLVFKDSIQSYKKPKPEIKINWDEIPERIEWIAMDENGKWYGYENKPWDCITVWMKDGDSKYIRLHQLSIKGMPWKKSLIRRPEIATT